MAAGTEVAKAYVQIIPSAEGIKGKITSALDPEARSAGESAGNTIGQQIASFATKAIAALGIGKMISDSITNGMDFEKSMAKASTLFSGTSEELQQLQADIVDISSATGVAASELAEAAYSAESASVPMGNLGGMIESSAKLATAGFTDIDTALSATAKTMNAYGMMSDDVTETQKAMDEVQRILIQTQNKGITTVGELGASLAQVTPTAAAFGVSFDQVGAALAGMTAQGTPTAQATTQLNSLIAELGKEGTQASNNFRELTEYLQEGGLSFAEAMERGWDLSDVLSILDEGANVAGVSMVDMFSSIEAGKAALSIWNSDWAGNMEAMATEADVVGDAYSVMADTTSFKLEQMKNSLKNMGVSAFNEFAGPLSSAFDSVSQVIASVSPHLQPLITAFVSLFEQVAGWVADLLGLDSGMSTTETVASILTTTIDTLTSAVQFLVDNFDLIGPILATVVTAFAAVKAAMAIHTVITAVSGAMSALGIATTVAMGPLLLIVGAIAAVIAIGVALFKNWDTIKEKAGQLKDWLGEKFSAIKDKISESWNNVKEKTSEAWNNVKSTVSNMISSVQQNTQEKLNSMKQAFDQHGGGIKGATAAAWTAIKSNYQDSFNALDKLTGGKLSEIKDKFSEKFDGIKNGIREKMSAARDAFSDILGNIKSAITDKIGEALNWGRDLIGNLVSGIRDKIGAVRDAVGSIGSTISSFLHFTEPDVGPLSNFHTWMPDMIKELTSGIEKGIPNVELAMTDLTSSMIPSVGQDSNTTNVGGVTMNIYGAPGQDIDQLAEVIEEKLVTISQSRRAVFA